MITESHLVDQLTERALDKVSPSKGSARKVVFEVLAEFERDGIDVFRLSAWEKTRVVIESAKRLKKLQTEGESL